MMTEGQLASLAVVAAKLREQEAPLKASGDPYGLGVGAAALLVELAGDEIKRLVAENSRLSKALSHATAPLSIWWDGDSESWFIRD